MALGVTACADEPAVSAEPIAGAQAALGLDEQIALLLPHVDFASSQLSHGVAMASAPIQTAIDGAAFEQQLAAAVSASIDAQWNTGETRYAQIGTLRSVIEPVTRYVHVSDSRGYGEVGPGTATTEDLVQRSRELLTAMGIDLAEATFHTLPLGTQADGAEDPVRLGHKVFCLRTIGGLRVGGDRMVFSYATDGSLRALRGQWPAVHVESSVWSTSLTNAQIVNRALGAMVGAGAALTLLPIVVDTSYEHFEQGGLPALRLRVAATRQAGGPDASGGRGARYEADL